MSRKIPREICRPSTLTAMVSLTVIVPSAPASFRAWKSSISSAASAPAAKPQTNTRAATMRAMSVIGLLSVERDFWHGAVLRVLDLEIFDLVEAEGVGDQI